MTGMRRCLKVVFCGFCLFTSASLSAQDTPPRRRPVESIKEEQQEEATPPATRPRRSAEPTDNDEQDAPLPRRTTPRTKIGPARPGEERPTGEPLQVEQLDPKLETILKEWETETAKIKKLSGSFYKFSYDRTFAVELRAEGNFKYEAPDRGVYLVRGAKVQPGEKSKRTDDKGRPFTVKTDKTERWYCTGVDIFQINDADRSYDKMPIPEQSRGQNIIDGPLPFLFGMKAEQAKRRYFLTLEKETPDFVRINVKPKLQHDQANYCEATIILDRKTWLPRAVRLLDPTRNKETVHSFQDMDPSVPKWPLMDPFKPNLIGLKPVVHEPKNVQAVDEEPKKSFLPFGGPRNSAQDPPTRQKRTATNEEEDGASPAPRSGRKPAAPAEEESDEFPRRKSPMM